MICLVYRFGPKSKRGHRIGTLSCPSKAVTAHTSLSDVHSSTTSRHVPTFMPLGSFSNASFHKKVMVLSRAPQLLVPMRGRSLTQCKPKPWTKKKERTKKEIDHLLVFSQLFQNLNLIPYSLGGRRLVPFRAPALFQVALVVRWNFAISSNRETSVVSSIYVLRWKRMT